MNYSIYLHIPFCQHRCHYCDFNTYAGKEKLIPAYVKALIREIRIVSDKKPNLLVHTIYFGGGTPSLISLKLLDNILKALHSQFSVSKNCEITLEANPGTISYEYLKGLTSLGVNRISIGVQSTNSTDLIRLDRIHDLNHVMDSIKFARRAGFENINLDMIYGLPWQDLSSWQHSLTRAIYLKPDHFSVYSLIIEPGTPFFNWYHRGLISQQNQDLEADMFEYAINKLNDAGYLQYEISNWAKLDNNKDYRCQHNLQYWWNQPYFGFGAGAHGFVNQIRTENTKAISDYIFRINHFESLEREFPQSPAVITSQEVEKETQMKDFLMLGLRLVDEGVSVERFRHVYGCPLEKYFHREITHLINLGLVEWVITDQKRLRLTKRGVMVANQVFMAFV